MSPSPAQAVLDFWYDFASPGSYPAAMTVARRAADAGVAMRWRPISLGQMRHDRRGGADSSSDLQGEGDCMWGDLARACEAAGVPLTRPTVFPRDSRAALRAALACEAQRLDVAAFSRAVFDANFVRDQDISDVGRLGEILAEIDLPGAAVLELARGAEIEAALEAQTAKAAERGVSGAPAFTTPDGELFRGFDRMEQALARSVRTPSAPETA